MNRRVSKPLSVEPVVYYVSKKVTLPLKSTSLYVNGASQHTIVRFGDYRRPLLNTFHPAFGQPQVVIPKKKRRDLLSTVHPAFGLTEIRNLPPKSFTGPVSISGFFLAIDPNICVGGKSNRMNPNAQLTIKDARGLWSRVRYSCLLESTGGFKVEALVRTQVGWISPPVSFPEVPPVIHLGKGFDVSIPFVMHFTMVSILDETGHSTGSCLYFSGTPFIGLSCGLVRIINGKLVLRPEKDVDPERDTQAFYGQSMHRVHVRQLAFVFFKCAAWVLCAVLCIPYFDIWGKTKRLVGSVAPNWAVTVLNYVSFH